MNETRRKLISVNTPCFREEDTVRECYETVKRLFAEQLPDYDYEHIFCDNASPDRTAEILREIADHDPRVKVILNSRNFGPFANIFNGLMSAGGDAVVVMLPCDLQDPPEVIVEFVKRWEAGYKVVCGIRAQRQESFLMRNVRKAYYRMVNRFANIDIPKDVGEFQLIDRAVVEALRRCDDYYPYIRGMIANAGFSTTGVAYTWQTRKRGITSNNLYSLIDQGLNGLISFTNIPLRLCLGFGLLLSILSITYAIVNLLINLIFFRKFAEPGIPTLIVALFFFSGVQLFFFGVLGEYIGAIHSQVRRRPLVTEQERINFDP